VLLRHREKRTAGKGGGVLRNLLAATLFRAYMHVQDEDSGNIQHINITQYLEEEGKLTTVFSYCRNHHHHYFIYLYYFIFRNFL
jgi:hypothetical protein